MSKILCLETATTNCSVALSVDGRIEAIREDKSPGYSHAELLHVFIHQVLEETGLNVSQLDAIAVSKGPGSYTGLRIGVSAAKGLCFAADIPLIAIPTLQILALGVETPKGHIVPMLDARRMEVYTAVYDNELNLIERTRAEVLNTGSFDRLLSEGPVVFIGSGVQKFKELCDHPHASFVTDLPSARQMGQLAEEKHQTGDTEDVAYFEPYYLKDFIVG